MTLHFSGIVYGIGRGMQDFRARLSPNPREKYLPTSLFFTFCVCGLFFLRNRSAEKLLFQSLYPLVCASYPRWSFPAVTAAFADFFFFCDNFEVYTGVIFS